MNPIDAHHYELHKAAQVHAWHWALWMVGTLAYGFWGLWLSFAQPFNPFHPILLIIFVGAIWRGHQLTVKMREYGAQIDLTCDCE